MIVEDIETLRGYTDKLLRITTTDGEEMIVKIGFLINKYQDFICDIISTDRAMKYKALLGSAAYTIPYDDVASFALIPETH